jgi:hypothetical protein
MRKALASLAGLPGLAALVRALRRRPSAPPTPPPAPSADPAEELRRRLEETRSDGPAAGASGAETEPAASPTLEERRARVHARAQEAIELMRDPGDAT